MIAQFLLRFGLALVFGWFGIDKLINPGNWTQFLPGFLPFDQGFSITIIAAVEIFVAVLMFTKFFKVGAAIAALELAFVISLLSIKTGISLIAVRDTGLLFMSLALLAYRGHEELARAELHNMLRGKRPKKRV